jgi:drug/metabolite transporter (DMT)-like permease
VYPHPRYESHPIARRHGFDGVLVAALMLSMFAATAMILLTKRLIQKYDSLEITAWMIVIGTLILLVWTESSHALRIHFSRDVWAAAAAQGLLGNDWCVFILELGIGASASVASWSVSESGAARGGISWRHDSA